MSQRFQIHTRLLLLKMRLLINVEFNVKLELHDADALAWFFYYSSHSCQEKLKQLGTELEKQTIGEHSPTAAAC